MEQIDGTDWPVLYRHVGCGGCGKTGYRGRFALHEVMLVTEEIETLIIERRSTEDIKKVAIMEGMIPLRADGLRKVGAGHHQPRRGLPRRHLSPLRRSGCQARTRPAAALAESVLGRYRHKEAVDARRVRPGSSASSSSIVTCCPVTTSAIAIAESRRTGDPLPAVLHRNGLVGEKDLTRGHRRDGRPALHRLHRVPDPPGRRDAPSPRPSRAARVALGGRLRGHEARRRVRRPGRRRRGAGRRARDRLRDHPGRRGSLRAPARDRLRVRARPQQRAEPRRCPTSASPRSPRASTSTSCSSMLLDQKGSDLHLTAGQPAGRSA